jgi:hypothetical protein
MNAREKAKNSGEGRIGTSSVPMSQCDMLPSIHMRGIGMKSYGDAKRDSENARKALMDLKARKAVIISKYGETGTR